MLTIARENMKVLPSIYEVIERNFGGNWEAMSGDVAFEPELQRCIGVDVRYVLFIIEKFAGAKWLIDELDVAK